MVLQIKSSDLSENTFSQFWFLRLRVYKDDPHYCLPFQRSFKNSLEEKMFVATQRFFWVEDGGEIIAGLVVRISPTLKNEKGEKIGLIGFFEAYDHAKAVKLLFVHAIKYLHEIGIHTIIGPMDSDTWHRYRLNIGPFDSPPFLMEPYNPPYYPRLWEGNDFITLADYKSLRVENIPAVLDKLKPFYKRAISRGITLRTLRKEIFDEEMKILYALSTEIFSDNFLYSPISYKEFRELYSGMMKMIESDLVWFAQEPTGRNIGFIFCFRNYAQAVASMKGQSDVLAKFKFIINMKKAKAINFKTIGVIKDFRNTSVAGALVYQEYTKTIEKGYKIANLCLIKDDNPSGGLDGGEGKEIRHYRIYKYSGAL